MANQSYTSPFTGSLVVPTDTSYNSISLTTNGQLIWPDEGVVGITTGNSNFYYARIIDVTATLPNLVLNLPTALQGSVGSDILFRNLGPNDFTVANFGDVVGTVVGQGKSQWFYLTTNNTAAGSWGNVQFGAGTSSADATSLQGSGTVVANNNKLGVGFQVIDNINTNYTLSDTSWGKTHIWTGGSGTFTITTPTANGWMTAVRNEGTGQLTIQAASVTVSNYLIDKAQSIQLLPGESTFIVFNKVGVSTGAFYSVGRNRLTNFYFSSSLWDINVTGATLNLSQYATVIQRYIESNSTTSTAVTVTLPQNTNTYYVINGTSRQITFTIAGSSSTVLLNAGSTATLVSDGTNLYANTVVSAGALNLVASDKITPGIGILDTATPPTRSSGLYASATNSGITYGHGAAYIEVNGNTIVLSPAVLGQIQAVFDGGSV